MRERSDVAAKVVEGKEYSLLAQPAHEWRDAAEVRARDLPFWRDMLNPDGVPGSAMLRLFAQESPHRNSGTPLGFVRDITSRSRARTSAASRHSCGRLREQGISFALDNFGRDIGSLSHLNSLPVSCIKIDGSFSRDLLDSPKSQSMVVAITKLANVFGLETVAGTSRPTRSVRAPHNWAWTTARALHRQTIGAWTT